MPERFAIYYAPAPSSRLWTLAIHWLERDPAGGAIGAVEVPGVAREDRVRLTESARRYGFHATIKAPMALAAGRTRTELEEALAAFAAGEPPVPIGELVLTSLGGFLALVTTPQPPALTALAERVVKAFEPFRAPLSAEDRARRVAAHLSPRQIALLDQYGYPYVLDEFLFHMTLTDRLPPDLAPAVEGAAGAWFAPAIAEPVVLDRLALFHQTDAAAPFRRIADFPLATEVQP